jgi:beta-xylosidase
MPLQYQNPVYANDFADPFVLKTPQGYFAYGTTQPAPDGRIFGILHSEDLIHWKPVGGGLIPLQYPTCYSYWAPEVAQKGGRYYMYYSASTTPSDENHRLRVATADNPAGPFTDSGRLLLPDEGFSIDASPFRDALTGRHYLYFAKDFESEEPLGTGLAVVELTDDLLAARSQPRTVVRAQADWQIYERNRHYKGRLWETWSCVEGPSVVFHENKYYCFYSGGAWYGDSYGVGFAIADHPLGPWRSDASIQVLSAIPSKVIGPGHNSTALSPGGTLYMIYHAWDAAKTARRMCIDRIQWTAGGPKVDGPSTTPQFLE